MESLFDRRTALALAAWVVGAGAVGLAVKGVPADPAIEGGVVLYDALYCLLLGTVEEVVFCGILLPWLLRIANRVRACDGVAATTGGRQGLPRRSRRFSFASSECDDASRAPAPTPPRGNALPAAIACAALFGAAHVGTGWELGLGWVGAAAKVVQAALFGLCMAALYLRTRNLAWPMLVHAAFDFVYLGIPLVLDGAMPYADGFSLPADTAASLAVVALLLLPAAAFAVLRLRGEVVTYQGLHEKKEEP